MERSEQLKQYLKMLEDHNQMKQDLQHNERILGEVHNALKSAIELDNQHFIGKAAVCTVPETKGSFECICSKVMCTSEFKIKPLFTRMGKKMSVDTYEFNDKSLVPIVP